MKKILALSVSYVAFIMLINVKMPTTVGILFFMSLIFFVLSGIEHGKFFITSGPCAIINSQCLNYHCLKQIFMVSKFFKPFNSGCICRNYNLRPLYIYNGLGESFQDYF